MASSLWSQGPSLCPGQRATVHCNITGGTLLTWQYGSDQLVSIIPAIGSLPPDDPVMVGGVAFTVSLVSATPDLVSEISFVVSSIINGMVLRCSGVDASGVAERSVTLQEEIGGECFIIVFKVEVMPAQCIFIAMQKCNLAPKQLSPAILPCSSLRIHLSL